MPTQVKPKLLQRFLIKRNIFFIFIILIATFLVVATISFGPLNLYLKFYSKLHPQALSINGEGVSWTEFEEELVYAKYDKNLKTEQQRIKKAIDRTIERHLLKQSLGEKAKAFANLSLFTQTIKLKETILANNLSWRTGAYFIAHFASSRSQASESATEVKEKSKAELTKIRDKLIQGGDTKLIVSEANNNQFLKNLNFGTFGTGNYLEKVTKDDFPLKIKSFRNTFFTLPAKGISEILIISWDDYDGPYKQPGGEFAYGLIKIDELHSTQFDSYDSWLDEQRKKASIKSYIFIPFYFKL